MRPPTQEIALKLKPNAPGTNDENIEMQNSITFVAWLIPMG